MVSEPGKRPARGRRRRSRYKNKQGKGGRPYALMPTPKVLKTISGLGHIQCTYEECAAVLGVTKLTWMEFLEREPRAREVYERGKENGKSSVRRNLFKQSETNVAAAIWLSKNLLGMREPKNEHEHSGRGGAPIAFLDAGKLATLTDAELDRIETALAQIAVLAGSGAGGGEGGEAPAPDGAPPAGA